MLAVYSLFFIVGDFNAAAAASAAAASGTCGMATGLARALTLVLRPRPMVAAPTLAERRCCGDVICRPPGLCMLIVPGGGASGVAGSERESVPRRKRGSERCLSSVSAVVVAERVLGRARRSSAEPPLRRGAVKEERCDLAGPAGLCSVLAAPLVGVASREPGGFRLRGARDEGADVDDV